jgi:hypothetical protein
MVSTDGHRLSKVERTLANGPHLAHAVPSDALQHNDLQAAAHPGSGHAVRLVRGNRPGLDVDRISEWLSAARLEPPAR